MKTISSLILLLAVSCATPVIAAQETANAQVISKQQAMKIAQKTNPGRVLSIKLKQGAYQVKMLNTKGEVRIIQINANNGKMVNEQ